MTGAQFGEASGNLVVEQLEVQVLVFDGAGRSAAALRDLFGKLNHLIHRLFAGEAADEFLDDGGERSLRFTGTALGQNFDHHGDHDVHPAGADGGDGTVEIEEGDPGMRGRGGAKLFHHVFILA